MREIKLRVGDRVSCTKFSPNTYITPLGSYIGWNSEGYMDKQLELQLKHAVFIHSFTTDNSKKIIAANVTNVTDCTISIWCWPIEHIQLFDPYLTILEETKKKMIELISKIK